MISKSLIKYVQSLHLRKYRQKYNKFIAQGPKIAIEIIQSGKVDLEYIFGTSDFIENNQDLLSSHRSKVHIVSDKDLERISTTKTANSVVLVGHKIQNDHKTELNNQWTLFLDKVQDPGNVGTIIRIADWFGISSVFLSPECADLYNPKVLQSTMGGFLRVNVVNTEFHALKVEYPELKVYATHLKGKSMYELDLKPGLIVIGNESKGIQDNIVDASNVLIAIPSKGKAESLNAAVACGIIVANLLQ